MKFSALFGSCLFGRHGNRVRARDAHGRLVLRCQECQDDQIVLAPEPLPGKGPAHIAAEVYGRPIGKVTRTSTRSKVLGGKF